MALEIDSETLKALMREIRDEAEMLRAGPWSDIKAHRSCWEVRHDDECSIANMTDEELRQSVVADLLQVHSWEREGKAPTFHPDDFKRFIPASMHARVDEALADPFVRSLIVTLSDGQVRVHPHHLQEAMDFCGVWLEGYLPLSDGSILMTDRDAIDDFLDDGTMPSP